MGVINLGLLVEKIKKKLEGSGFIKNTDYATASAAGVVMIGDNIDVDDGVISVTFPSAGGFTADAIWSGTLTNDFVDITESLTHPVSDYKFLAINRVNGVNVSASEMLYVPLMSSGTNNQNVINYDNNTPVTIRIGDGTVSIKGSATTAGITLIGIK